MTSDQAPSDADFVEPAAPGTSMTYAGGKQFRRYLIWYALVVAAITAVWGGVLAVILPNQVQTIEFARWFTGSDSGVDLTALNNLQAAVAAGTTTATADQQRLLGILTNFDAARAQALSLVTSVAVAATMVVQPCATRPASRCSLCCGPARRPLSPCSTGH